MAHGAPDQNANAALVDDCWNRIGTRGDNSCPRLAEYKRCVECPVFEKAAATLLERINSDLKSEWAPPAASDDATTTQAAFVFRIAHEWLALPAAAIDQIGERRPIHSIPHRRDPIVLGLVNVRGTPTIAVSLAAALNLEQASAATGTPRNFQARMLVAAYQGQSAAFPVDEAEGIVRFLASELMPVPSTLAHAALSHARGVLKWRDTSVGLLDAGCIFESLARSLR